MAAIFIGSGDVGTKASVSAFTESGHQAAQIPEFVDDGLSATYWWGNSATAWLKLDLGSPQEIVAMRFAKTDGNWSTVEISDNDSDWTTVASIPSTGSGGSDNLNAIMVGWNDGPKTARYWRFTDTGGSWPKIVTIELLTSFTITSTGGVVADRVSGNQWPALAIDGDTATYWQTDGVAGWAGLDFTETVTVNTIDFNCGTYTHDILGSTDGETWDTLFSAVNFVDDVNQQFEINADYRFIRLSAVAWSAIREVSADFSPISPPAPPADPTPDSPSGGFSGHPSRSPNAQSWRLALDKRRKYGRSQYWK